MKFYLFEGMGLVDTEMSTSKSTHLLRGETQKETGLDLTDVRLRLLTTPLVE